MGEIINLDNYRPYIRLTTIDGNEHVFPVEMVENLIEGKLSIDDVDQGDIVIRSVLKDWLAIIRERDNA